MVVRPYFVCCWDNHSDFGQMLSIVQYFDKPIIGIDKLAEYYDRTITSSKENYIEKTNSKMVA